MAEQDYDINFNATGAESVNKLTEAVNQFAAAVSIADGLVTQLDADLKKFGNVDFKALKNAKELSHIAKSNAYANQAQKQADYTDSFLKANGASITAEAKHQNTRKTKRLEDFYATQEGQEVFHARMRKELLEEEYAARKIIAKIVETETKNEERKQRIKDKTEKQAKKEASKYDSSFGQSILYGLKGYEEKIAAQRNLTGYLGKGLGNLLKDSKVGNLFGGGILGKGLNLGVFVPTAIAQGVKAIVDVHKKTLAVYGEIESLTTQLEVIHGNPINAAAMFDDIKNYAIKSPYGVTQVTEFAVLLKQSGVYSKDVLDTMKKIGDVAGGNAEKMKRIANNYAQIQAAGKATTLDLRQFANAGIPIYKELRELLGVSQQELRSMTAEGKITSNIIENVFNKMTSVGGTFYNATKLGSQTYKAQTTNLKDVSTLALGKVGEALYTNAFGVQNESVTQSVIDAGYKLFELIEKMAALEVDDNRIKNLERAETAVINLKRIFTHIQNFPEDSNVQSYFSDTVSDENLNKIKLDMVLQRGSSYKKRADEINNQEMIITAYLDLFKELSKRKGVTAQQYQKLVSMFNEDIANAGYDYFLKESFFMWDKDVPLNLKSDISHLEDQKYKLGKMRNKNERTGFRDDYIQTTAFDLGIYADYLDEYQLKNEKSNSKFNEYVTQKYKETEDFKKKQEEEELNKIKEIRKRYDYSKQKGMSNENLSWMNGIKPEQAYELLKTHYSGVDFDFSKEFSEKDRDTFIANMENLRKYSESVGTTIEDIFQIETIKSSAKEDNIEDFRFKLGKFKEYVEGMGDENLKNIFLTMTNSLEFIEIDGDKLAAVEAELEKGKKKAKEKIKEEVVPFWKRTISSVLGIPVEFMRDFEKKGFSGKDIINNVAKNKYARDSSSNIALALLKDNDRVTKQSKYSLQSVASFLRYDSKGNIDQMLTNKNLTSQALSLNTGSAVTQAYQSSLQSQLDAIHRLFAEGFTKFEDLDKLKSEEYQKAYGYSATEADMLITAFSEKLQKAADGTVSFEESTMQALNAWELETDALLETAKSMVLYKQTVEGLTDSTRILQDAIRMSVDYKNYTYLQKTYGNKFVDEIQNIPNSIKGKISNTDNLKYKNLSVKDIVDFALLGPEGQTSKIISLQEAVDLKLEETDKMATPSIDDELSEIETYKKLQELLNDYSKNKFLVDVSKYQSLANSSKKEFDNAKTFLDNLHPKKIVPNIKQNFAMQGFGIQDAETWKDFVEKTKGSPELQETLGLKDIEGVSLEEQLLGKGLEFNSLKTIKSEFESLGQSIQNAFSSEVIGQFSNSLELIGSNIAQGKDATDGLAASWKEAGKSILSTIGASMTSAGLNIAASAALEKNWGFVAGGLALAAAGGVMSFTSGLMSEPEEDTSDDSSDEEQQKIQNLKDALSDLIDQAKTDAEYYQKHYLHKKALAENYSISVKHVNDAIITPEGQIVSTHPDDYLIATKEPHALLGQRGNVSPTVNFTVINNAGSEVKIEQQQKKNSDGSVDIQAVITKVVNSAIASGKLDGAFAQRDNRLRGRVVTS